MPVDPRISLLSAALFSHGAASDLCEGLSDQDFPNIHRPLYSAIREVLVSAGEVSASSVAAALSRADIADPYHYLLTYLSDGEQGLQSLVVDTPGRKLVIEHIRNQRVRADLTTLVSEQRYEEIPPYLAALNGDKPRTEGLITERRIVDFLDLIKANAGKTTLGYPTGLPSLDEITGGMMPGTLWAVGAPTSAGKTTLLCQMVVEAIKGGATCLFFSLEMSIPLMYARLAGAWSNINPTRIFRGRINESDRSLVEGALRLFAECGLRVYREVSGVDEIAQRVREARLSRPVDVVAVDFLQNVTVRADNMLQRMAEASRILQDLAGNTNSCVLVASQLSNEGVRDKGGGLFSYRYASELAHAADIGIEMVVESASVVINVRKNRHGRTGAVKARFNDHWSAFLDCDVKPPGPPRDLWGGH